MRELYEQSISRVGKYYFLKLPNLSTYTDEERIEFYSYYLSEMPVYSNNASWFISNIRMKLNQLYQKRFKTSLSKKEKKNMLKKS